MKRIQIYSLPSFGHRRGEHSPRKVRSSKSGQTMVEFSLIALILVGAVAIMAVLLYTLRLNHTRVLDLVASEYP